MGDQRVDAGPDESQEVNNTYTVIAYPAQGVPDSYRAMIFSKWLRSLRFGNDYFKLIDSTTYYAKYHIYLEELLRRPMAVARFAVLSDDHDVVLGFSLTEAEGLHYVHVHKDHRNKGIGTALVPKNIYTISHLTKIGLSIWNSKLPHAKFNPFF